MKSVYRFKAMSTSCELIIYNKNRAKNQEVAEKILLEIKRLEKKYNYFSSNSLLTQINQRRESRLDLETISILKNAKRYYTQTDHIFDITLATIKPLFQTTISLDEFEKERDILLPFVGCEHYEIKRDKIKFDNPYTKIDLGGYIKEYAVDRSAKIIYKSKIKSALINFGGDIYAVGTKLDGERFKIGIKNPRNPKEFIKFIDIENQALATSASYERNYTIEDKVFSHILYKKPPINPPLSATVVSNSCLNSGVFSTSLMLNRDIKVDGKIFLVFDYRL